MTKQEIYDFVTELLDGNSIPEVLFDTFLNTAQMYYENRRPWAVLRTEDTSQTVTPGNTYEVEKSLPDDFRKWYTRFPVVLTDAQGNAQQYLAEIPLDKKMHYKDNSAKFYCNYRTKKLYICGNVNQGLTVRQYYIQKSPLVSLDGDNLWIFPDEYHPILGFTVAVYFKLGVDYDIINNAQADNNAAVAKSIFNSMEEWDGELAESALNGQDYGRNAQGGGEMSGHIVM